MRLALVIGALTWWVGSSAESAVPAVGKPPVGKYQLSLSGPSLAGVANESLWAELEGMGVRWIAAEAWKSRLAERDRQAGLLDQAGEQLKMGRTLHLGLKLEQAKNNYRRAIAILEGGFARHYDPGLLAEPLLQLGVALFQSGDEKGAQEIFVRVTTLAPALTLSEGYYSPSVRRAFSKARQARSRTGPQVPGTGELARICSAADLRGMLVVSQERLGDRPLLRLSLFDARQRSFVAVETAVIVESGAEALGRDLAQRIRPAVAGVAGIALALLSSPDGGHHANSDREAGDDDDGSTDTAPWYARHWWIWPLTAAVVGAAIALPLTVFREDVVDVRVRY